MKEDFKNYLTNQGLATAIIQKVADAYNFYINVAGISSIDDIFISEYKQEDGNKVFENVWFFNNEMTFEIKNLPSSELNYDFCVIKKSIKYLNVLGEKYNFDNNTNTDSKISVKFTTIDEIHGEMKASDMNCINLNNIMKKYLINNIIERV